MICYQCEYEWLNECHAMGLFGRSVARVFGNEPYSFFQLIEVRNNGHIAFINNIDRWVSQTPGESILQSPLKNCDWNNANLANDIFPDYNWIWLGQNESDIRREWQHIRVPIWANSRLFIFFSENETDSILFTATVSIELNQWNCQEPSEFRRAKKFGTMKSHF